MTNIFEILKDRLIDIAGEQDKAGTARNCAVPVS